MHPSGELNLETISFSVHCWVKDQVRRGIGLKPCPDVTKAVIELSGGWEGSTPSSFFNPPACSQKLPWRVRLNPTEQRSIAQCILLSASIKRFPTRVSFRMIRSSEAMTVLRITCIYLFTSVDVAHADVLFLYIYAIYTAMYRPMRLYCGSREIKNLNVRNAI